MSKHLHAYMNKCRTVAYLVTFRYHFL